MLGDVILIRFQNISCYCLTYKKCTNANSLSIFQNISCYCLTDQTDKAISKLNLFQNISCYCLTRQICFLMCFWHSISKHLMLLFNSCFSHSFWINMQISKHLMLLFNRNPLSYIHTVFQFQNISCYCLT